MEETRRFRLPLKPLLMAVVVAAVAANLPRGWFEEQTPATRRADVFSAFVNLSAAPGQGELTFLQSLSALTGQAKRAQKNRVARVHPEVLARYKARHEIFAMARGLPVQDVGESGSLDLAAVTVLQPDFAHHGQLATWSWGVAEGQPTRPVTGQGELPGCGVAVVFWTAEEWYYAPIGLPEMDTILTEAVPEMAALPFAQLPRCVAND
ncbi:MAG: hypothetical protein AAFW87_06565 [Pseudomonadota bacterium]